MGENAQYISLSKRGFVLRLMARAFLFSLCFTGCTTAPPVPVVERERLVLNEKKPSELLVNIDSGTRHIVDGVVANVSRLGQERANDAVRQLLKTVDSDISAGNFSSAAATIDRAIRVAPGDAWAWHKLAQLHFAQGATSLATSVALRSSALPNADYELIAANWLLIAEIERTKGDLTSANAASVRAAGYKDKIKPSSLTD